MRPGPKPKHDLQVGKSYTIRNSGHSVTILADGTKTVIISTAYGIVEYARTYFRKLISQ